jgi:hypothetical protein
MTAGATRPAGCYNSQILVQNMLQYATVRMLTSSDLQSDVPTSATTMLHANATTNIADSGAKHAAQVSPRGKHTVASQRRIKHTARRPCQHPKAPAAMAAAAVLSQQRCCS